MECVQECEETGSVEGAKDGMVMEDAMAVDKAAHKVIFPPCWPGTLTMAFWPMVFLPRRLLLDRLKPTSSMKMN